eukprot:TRINITY_DN23519_c0_g1_i1.p1 TRINITY_DN23519_c0_g1~~TRINITY_DN23519_c0_g1_i1.p1  ORF type:complete len:874 (-),score=141.85 TRINITY_DN23519_c0_g1_i1:78-2615(-)
MDEYERTLTLPLQEREPDEQVDELELGTDRGYTSEQTIGRGTFGVALLARSCGGSSRVMKAVELSSLNTKMREEAAEEVKVMKRLRHPCIVQYHESFMEKGMLVIVMDYAEGGDLSQQIQAAKQAGSRLPEDKIVRWMTQVFLGVKHIHDLYVIHRDLKNENVFLDRSNQIRIGDFGLARILCKPATAIIDDQIVGTPSHLSPEICNNGVYSTGSDMWALGCMLYELMALCMPYRSKYLPSLMVKITTGPAPEPPTGYSTELAEICEALLCKSCSQRPSACEILQRPLLREAMKDLLGETEDELGSRRLTSQGNLEHSCTVMVGSPASRSHTSWASSPQSKSPSHFRREFRRSLFKEGQQTMGNDAPGWSQLGPPPQAVSAISQEHRQVQNSLPSAAWLEPLVLPQAGSSPGRVKRAKVCAPMTDPEPRGLPGAEDSAISMPRHCLRDHKLSAETTQISRQPAIKQPPEQPVDPRARQLRLQLPLNREESSCDEASLSPLNILSAEMISPSACDSRTGINQIRLLSNEEDSRSKTAASSMVRAKSASAMPRHCIERSTRRSLPAVQAHRQQQLPQLRLSQLMIDPSNAAAEPAAPRRIPLQGLKLARSPSASTLLTDRSAGTVAGETCGALQQGSKSARSRSTSNLPSAQGVGTLKKYRTPSHCGGGTCRTPFHGPKSARSRSSSSLPSEQRAGTARKCTTPVASHGEGSTCHTPLQGPKSARSRSASNLPTDQGAVTATKSTTPLASHVERSPCHAHRRSPFRRALRIQLLPTPQRRQRQQQQEEQRQPHPRLGRVAIARLVRSSSAPSGVSSAHTIVQGHQRQLQHAPATDISAIPLSATLYT